MQLNLCVKQEIRSAGKLQILILSKSNHISQKKGKKPESFQAADRLAPVTKQALSLLRIVNPCGIPQYGKFIPEIPGDDGIGADGDRMTDAAVGKNGRICAYIAVFISST
jgi:hypothetical protein